MYTLMAETRGGVEAALDGGVGFMGLLVEANVLEAGDRLVVLASTVAR